MRLHTQVAGAACLALLVSCAANEAPDPTAGLTEVTGMTSPDAAVADAVVDNERVEHGKYLVKLLGCGSCHTEGALFGAPEQSLLLAGSSIGIAYSTPLEVREPAITFPTNLTPDKRTGIGRLNVEQISEAIRHGRGRYGRQLNPVMPWWGYASLSESDANAIAQYLKSIPPISHQVPSDVEEGQRTNESFVYFGVYERDAGN